MNKSFVEKVSFWSESKKILYLQMKVMFLGKIRSSFELNLLLQEISPKGQQTN